jgi:hypothetical protein
MVDPQKILSARVWSDKIRIRLASELADKNESLMLKA